MSCLHGRLDSLRALTEVFAKADGSTVEKATSAAGGLPDLDRCSNVPILRAVVKPPDDPTTRRRVDEMKPRVAQITALAAAGHYVEARSIAPPMMTEASAIDYLPLKAQAQRAMAEITTDNLAKAMSYAEVALWSAQAGGDDEIVAETAVYLGYLSAVQGGDFERSRTWLQLGEATLNRLGGHELWRSWLLNNRGVLADLEGHAEEGMEAQRQAVALKEKILGRENPDVAISLGNWASALAKLKRLPEALEISERAVRIADKSLGPSHPNAAFQRVSHAEILNAAGRFADAERFARASIQVFEREAGPHDPVVAWSCVTLGRSLVERGLYSEARPVLERALAFDTHNPRDVAQRAQAAFLLARALWAARPERRRALTLALEAKRDYASGPDKEALSGVERWLHDRDAM